jgi:hypothetical protein
MFVTALSKIRGVTGLLVGAENVRRFFPHSRTVIELELGDLKIQCSLRREFWADNPEILDPRLSAWLETKHMHANASRSPVPLALMPSGISSYKLESVRLSAVTRKLEQGMLIQMPQELQLPQKKLVNSETYEHLRIRRAD